MKPRNPSVPRAELSRTLFGGGWHLARGLSASPASVYWTHPRGCLLRSARPPLLPRSGSAQATRARFAALDRLFGVCGAWWASRQAQPLSSFSCRGAGPPRFPSHMAFAPAAAPLPAAHASDAMCNPDGNNMTRALQQFAHILSPVLAAALMGRASVFSVNPGILFSVNCSVHHGFDVDRKLSVHQDFDVRQVVRLSPGPARSETHHHLLRRHLAVGNIARPQAGLPLQCRSSEPGHRQGGHRGDHREGYQQSPRDQDVATSRLL